MEIITYDKKIIKLVGIKKIDFYYSKAFSEKKAEFKINFFFFFNMLLSLTTTLSPSKYNIK